MPTTNDQLPPNPIADLFYKLEAALKYLDKVSDKPEEHQQAAIDALVTDVMPGLQKMSAGMAKFVDDTINVVHDIHSRLSVLEQANAESDEDEEDAASILLEEDAEKISNFVIASLGVITKHVPANDPSRAALLELGKEILQFVKDAKLEEEGDEDEEDNSAGATQ